MFKTILIRTSTNQLKSAYLNNNNNNNICSLPSRYFYKLTQSYHLERNRTVYQPALAFDKLNPLSIYSQTASGKKKLLLSNKFSRMTLPCVNYFAHSFIDRCSDKRKDKKFIGEQMKSDKAVYILFHVDKPFVKIDDSKSSFVLCKLNYSQVKFMVEEEEVSKTNENEGNARDKSSSSCTCVFLGLQYEKNADFATDESQSSCSPYSNPGLYNNKDSFTPWFAVDTSSYDLNLENVRKLFLNEGEFFEGNFLRMMAIQDELESSIIAQVSFPFYSISYVAWG
jgi:hypothetical protein